jgi:choline/glycine/proline betaine transport protein
MADADERGGQSEGLQVELFHPDSDREPGDTNVQRWGFDVHPKVFPISGLVIALFVATTLLLGERATTIYTGIFEFINTWFGWFYILAVNVFIVAILYFAFSKYGKIRIGGVEAEKEFSDFAWMAMLFSAGMGIGLMFFSVAEPMWHFSSGGGSFFGVEPKSPAAAEAALGITYFHWGFHPWAIYGLVGLGLAFFSFNRGLPLTFRSIFWPLLGDRIYGWPGHVIDLVTVFAALFGLSTSLGLGAQQINAGLAEVTRIVTGSAMVAGDSTLVQIAIIAVVTGIATASVAAGLEGGVKRLSEINVYLMLTFLAFMLLVGPTLFIFDSIVQSLGTYLIMLPEISFYTEAFSGSTWQHAWTIFYWGWWIAWAPFVGMFIARISKGRTVREFVVGVLVLPSLFSFVWLGTFGGAALFVQLEGSGGILTTLTERGQTFAMFELLSNFPLTIVTSVVAIFLVVTFFVTSSDSGSLVVDHLTSGGKHDVPRTQRVFWAVTEGVVAAVLLVGGGLSALQTAAITTGLPFAVILLLMCYTVYLGLDRELEILESQEFRETVAQLSESDDVVAQRTGTGHVTSIERDESPGD